MRLKALTWCIRSAMRSPFFLRLRDERADIRSANNFPGVEQTVQTPSSFVPRSMRRERVANLLAQEVLE